MNSQPVRETFDVKEAAEVLGVSEVALRRAVAAGHVPSVGVPGIRRVLLSKQEIERILHGNGTSEARQRLSAA